ncbi:MAG: TPM domain-containing protein [Ruminococcus sp.]|nr:TPM domain-containing protein [Ruminococcus sp.]
MKKRILCLLFAILLCFACVTVACAESALPRLVDDADLLVDFEEEELLSLLDEISERQQFDVVVVTVQSLDGYSAQAYADDFYDYNGYGYGSDYDGALLLLAMDEREWHISTCGYGITALTDYGIEYIGDEMLSDLSGGFYYDAFVTFAELCDDFVTQAKYGEPFDNYGSSGESYDSDDSFPVFTSLLISLVIGLVVGLIAVLIMKGQLKSVSFKQNANSYEKQGSMQVTGAHELFLYRTVNRVKKAENNSSSGGGSSVHTSSSGRSHGGGGGRF